jgi:ABC-type branched-subunit amino acid transport system ATPase component
MADCILSVTQLSRAFGAIQAVDDVSLSIVAGQIYGLVGPDGAGRLPLSV